MSKTIRGLAILTLVMLGMALLHGAIQAATGSNAIAIQPTADTIFTRQVTGTIYSSVFPVTPALTSLWQTQYYSFNLQLPSTFPILITPPLFPADAQIITYGINGGSAVRVGQIITFVITTTDAAFSFDYLTQQQVVLEGDHYRVNQTARANQPYRYISTAYFSQPYQYSGFIHEMPTNVSSYTVSWDVLPPSVVISTTTYYLFDSSFLLTDTDSPIYTVLLPIVMKQH